MKQKEYITKEKNNIFYYEGPTNAIKKNLLHIPPLAKKIQISVLDFVGP